MTLRDLICVILGGIALQRWGGLILFIISVFFLINMIKSAFEKKKEKIYD